MATWKKVIVSGSQAELAALSASIAVLVGTNQQITTEQSSTFLTGSFTGSFKGVADLPDLTNSTGITAFTYDGSTTATVSISGAAALSPSNVPKWTGDGFVDSGISDNGTTITISEDTVFQNDITVLGTASFQSTTNLEVADRFVLLASGSNSTGDGGLVIQQATQDVGELFGYENSINRWGFTSSFDAASSTFTAVSYVTTTEVGASAPTAAPIYGGVSNGYGNIYIKTDTGDIFIYS
jgi:hypothetical protein